MSSTSTPISPAIFALAIKDLPVDTLYAKAAELQNNIAHLSSSNAQLLPFAEDGDDVCKEAIAENDVVIQRMEERVGLCKVEVENRGLLWTGHADKTEEDVARTNDLVNGDPGHEEDGETGTARAPSGRLTDEELRRQLEAQMGEDDDDGVHL